MARLTEADARRLAGAVDAGRAPGAAVSVAAGEDTASGDRLRALFSDPTKLDELGRTLTLDLASYLRRPVRCSASATAAPIADAWRYEAALENGVLWMDFDAALGTAFGDAMIGGDGTGSIGRGKRARKLVERAAGRFIAAISAAAGVELAEGGADAAGDPRFTQEHALGGGLCAVAAAQFPWQAGVRVASPAARAEVAAAPAPMPASAPSSAGNARPLEAEAIVRAAIAEIHMRLERMLKRSVAAQDPNVTIRSAEESAALPPPALGLALTGRGAGAVVAFLDAPGVAQLAGALIGADVPPSDPPGDVAAAAAESALRDALEGVAGCLPSLADDRHRIVRLSEGALPASTQHHCADIALRVGERTGSLRLLVPSYMLGEAPAASRG